MKYVPLLFRRDMVRAIIGRRKQVTRRVRFNGVVGDWIWVRECFAGPFDGEYVYRADWSDDAISAEAALVSRFPQIADAYDGRWKPSIFMPREACRIYLEVVSVDKKPLQNMTAADAQREGFGFGSAGYRRFQQGWDQLNAKRGFGWDVNPDVFVIEFRRVNA